MSSRLHVIDSGGTARLVKRFFVIDAGGVARKVKRLFAVDSGGTARRVYVAYYLENTMTVSDDGGSSFGFSTGLYGSINGGNPYTDGNGNSRTINVNNWNFGSDLFIFTLAGASVPDTDATFGAIVVNGVRFTRASRTSYSGAGPSTWQWSGTGLVAGLPSTGTVPYIIEA